MVETLGMETKCMECKIRIDLNEASSYITIHYHNRYNANFCSFSCLEKHHNRMNNIEGFL